MDKQVKKLISIVIPCVNEEGNIGKLLSQLSFIIANNKNNFEVIVVNDGSKDDTWKVIDKYSHKYDFVIGIDQMGNFGQSQAYQAGFDIANGDYILTLSADLEIPTDNILKVIKYLDEGYDFVNTNRIKRWSEESMRKTKSGLANMILNKISGIKIQDRGSGLKGMTKALAKELQFYGDMHRFIPDYLSVYKPRIIEFEVEFKDREYGVSAYKKSSRSLKVFLDILTLVFLVKLAHKPFFMMPGRLFGITGFVLGLSGFVITAIMIFERVAFGYGLTTRPLFTLAITMILIGLILLLFGLFGELMMRVYYESSNRKRYMTKKIVGSKM
jgi:glycosyltransferase involved in cell wall biosynthesis